jgi:predicted acyltransferase
MNGERLVSLDAFRGLTIAAMILVNNPGSDRFVFSPLRHAEWHGWTPTDLIFPFFLFIVGVSLALSLSRRREAGRPPAALYGKIFERSIVLFGLGLFLQLFPYFHWGTMRIPGVLQRIAVCFLLGSLLYLKAGSKQRLVTVLALLAGYWLVLKLVPVPGHGAGVLSYEGNLPGYLDDKLMHGHLYERAFDPEGILSTFPALATTLIGTLIGDLLRSSRPLRLKGRVLFVLGLVLTAAGLVLHRWMPINKKLWTSTFVIFTAGAALLLLAVFFTLMEVLRWKKWASPWLVFGSNAILVYAGSILMVKLIRLISVGPASAPASVRDYVFSRLLLPWAGPFLGSLAYPLLLLAVWFLILLPLYRKKIFLRV